MKREELKDRIVSVLLSNYLSYGKDNGEHKVYHDLDKDYAADIAKELIEDLKYIGVGDYIKVKDIQGKRTTVGNWYLIYEKQDSEGSIQYTIWNDRGQPSHIYEDMIEEVKQ